MFEGTSRADWEVKDEKKVSKTSSHDTPTF